MTTEPDTQTQLRVASDVLAIATILTNAMAIKSRASHSHCDLQHNMTAQSDDPKTVHDSTVTTQGMAAIDHSISRNCNTPIANCNNTIRARKATSTIGDSNRKQPCTHNTHRVAANTTQIMQIALRCTWEHNTAQHAP